jgi:hypothetical protein
MTTQRVFDLVRYPPHSGFPLYSTVKAPNFDRVSMKNIFLLHIFVRWSPLKKIDRTCKIKVCESPKLKV